jgi:RimJ/RimL family protein N-acetyltransferase
MKNINQFNQEIGAPVHDWQPAKMPNSKNIVGRYCILEPLNKDKHGTKLFEILHANSGKSWTYLPYGPFLDLKQFEDWMHQSLEEKDSFFYAILDKKTNEPIGICAYLKINSEHGSIEVGHLNFSHLLQKTALATEAMYLMMKQVFDDLGYRRYEWKCHSMNKPSWQAAERLGFKFEGIFRNHFIIKGHSRDTAWFSIIDDEWPLLKDKLERWLDPINFDEQGKQIKKLQNI